MPRHPRPPCLGCSPAGLMRYNWEGRRGPVSVMPLSASAPWAAVRIRWPGSRLPAVAGRKNTAMQRYFCSLDAGQGGAAMVAAAAGSAWARPRRAQSRGQGRSPGPGGEQQGRGTAGARRADRSAAWLSAATPASRRQPLPHDGRRGGPPADRPATQGPGPRPEGPSSRRPRQNGGGWRRQGPAKYAARNLV